MRIEVNMMPREINMNFIEQQSIFLSVISAKMSDATYDVIDLALIELIASLNCLAMVHNLNCQSVYSSSKAYVHTCMHA